MTAIHEQLIREHLGRLIRDADRDGRALRARLARPGRRVGQTR
jgi:hypothetical protein